jgi:hypothetical protein
MSKRNEVFTVSGYIRDGSLFGENAAGHIGRQFTTPSAYRNDDGLKHEKEVALKYAKEATDIGSVPTPP